MRALMILAALPLAACGSVDVGSDSGTKAASSGTGTTRTFQVADFTGVDLGGSDNVDVKVGPAFSVTAAGPSELLDKLDIRKDGTTLKIDRIKGANSFNWGGNGDRKSATIHVTMPAIAMASVAGSGNMTVDKVAGGDFHASLAGSGDLSVAQIASTSADISVAGSGDVTLKGQTGKVKISVAGSGNVEGAGFNATEADVSIAGSGNVRADIAGPANVTIVGSGDADLGAGAKCTTSKIGSGEVKCGG